MENQSPTPDYNINISLTLLYNILKLHVPNKFHNHNNDILNCILMLYFYYNKKYNITLYNFKKSLNEFKFLNNISEQLDYNSKKYDNIIILYNIMFPKNKYLDFSINLYYLSVSVNDKYKLDRDTKSTTLEAIIKLYNYINWFDIKYQINDDKKNDMLDKFISMDKNYYSKLSDIITSLPTIIINNNGLLDEISNFNDNVFIKQKPGELKNILNINDNHGIFYLTIFQYNKQYNKQFFYESQIYNHITSICNKLYESTYRIDIKSSFILLANSTQFKYNIGILKYDSIKSKLNYTPKYKFDYYFFQLADHHSGNFSDIFMELLKKIKLDLINNDINNNNLILLISLIFELFYSFYLLNHTLDIIHNNCHFNNIYVDKLINPTKKFFYYINNKKYIFFKYYNVRIGNFDRSYLNKFDNDIIVTRSQYVLGEHIMKLYYWKDTYSLIIQIIMFLIKYLEITPYGTDSFISMIKEEKIKEENGYYKKTFIGHLIKILLSIDNNLFNLIKICLTKYDRLVNHIEVNYTNLLQVNNLLCTYNEYNDKLYKFINIEDVNDKYKNTSTLNIIEKMINNKLIKDILEGQIKHLDYTKHFINNENLDYTKHFINNENLDYNKSLMDWNWITDAMMKFYDEYNLEIDINSISSYIKNLVVSENSNTKDGSKYKYLKYKKKYLNKQTNSIKAVAL